MSASRALAQRLRAFPHAVDVDVHQHDLGAFRVEALGAGESDPARGAGDDGDLSLMLHVKLLAHLLLDRVSTFERGT